jgi:hypothetical protein
MLRQLAASRKLTDSAAQAEDAQQFGAIEHGIVPFYGIPKSYLFHSVH